MTVCTSTGLASSGCYISTGLLSCHPAKPCLQSLPKEQPKGHSHRSCTPSASSWRLPRPPPEPQGEPSKNISQAAFQHLVNGSAARLLLGSPCCPFLPSATMCSHCPTFDCPHWHLLLTPLPLSTPTGECQDLHPVASSLDVMAVL